MLNAIEIVKESLELGPGIDRVREVPGTLFAGEAP
jgi:hypothetical protein